MSKGFSYKCPDGRRCWADPCVIAQTCLGDQEARISTLEKERDALAAMLVVRRKCELCSGTGTVSIMHTGDNDWHIENCPECRPDPTSALILAAHDTTIRREARRAALVDGIFADLSATQLLWRDDVIDKTSKDGGGGMNNCDICTGVKTEYRVETLCPKHFAEYEQAWREWLHARGEEEE